MKKINIIGTSDSGKSTFAKKLSLKLNIEYTEMDSLYWDDNWTPHNKEYFLQKIEEITNKNQWILDGNYRKTIPIKWQKADTIIWLDYSFCRTFFQVFKRAILRIIDKKPLWETSNNKESFKQTFMSKDSILLWMISSYPKTKKRYKLMLKEEKYSHINIIHLKSPKECEEFLKNIKIKNYILQNIYIIIKAKYKRTNVCSLIGI